MNIGDKFTVNIEKMSNSGTGITHVNGIVVFVYGACTGDKLEITISKISKSFAEADILNILEPSKYRTSPFCPMQKVCGSCQLQHIDYDYQLEIKRETVQDALHSIAGIDIEVPLTIPSPDNRVYRHKIQYPVSQTKVSKRILAGYYKPQSHDIVNIKYCPIQPKICDEIIEFIRENIPSYKLSGYNEELHKGDLKHVVLRVSAFNKKVLVTLVLNAKNISPDLEKFAKKLYDNFEDVVGVCVNLNPKKTNVILSDKTLCLVGQDFVEEKLLDKVFTIGADTFFQVNPKSAENIFSYVKKEIEKSNNPSILDAYAGIATFGIVVSDAAKEVTSVEANNNSIKMAKEAAKMNGVSNVELFSDDTAKYLKKIKRKFDITILDPPRKGCTKESLDEAIKHTKDKIIYVSCNPATVARDLKYLLENGYEILSVQPFDMFCHTYHVETVVVLKNKLSSAAI